MWHTDTVKQSIKISKISNITRLTKTQRFHVESSRKWTKFSCDNGLKSFQLDAWCFQLPHIHKYNILCLGHHNFIFHLKAPTRINKIVRIIIVELSKFLFFILFIFIYLFFKLRQTKTLNIAQCVFWIKSCKQPK